MIRRSAPQDYKRLLALYEGARTFMKAHGNPTQWGDFSPTKARILEDIACGGYVAEEDGVVYGAFFLMPGPDPTYLRIEEGEWLNDEPYYVIHRICSDGKPGRGVLKQAVSFALTMTANIRIDTHQDNRVMREALTKLGFRYCGIISLPNGTTRRAYQYCADSAGKGGHA
ncbi:MAG: GNAT family N-acetyltransferase [Lachnospiraceae bacterium]|nr:GNAT family N-acetyltransferase [Lachnospiraceae bacterium]